MTGLVSFPNATYGGSTYRWKDGVSAGSDQDFRFIFVLPKWLSFWSGR